MYQRFEFSNWQLESSRNQYHSFAVLRIDKLYWKNEMRSSVRLLLEMDQPARKVIVTWNSKPSIAPVCFFFFSISVEFISERHRFSGIIWMFFQNKSLLFLSWNENCSRWFMVTANLSVYSFGCNFSFCNE